MTADLSIVDLALAQGGVFRFVLLCLLGLSLASWTIIFQKWWALRRAGSALDAARAERLADAAAPAPGGGFAALVRAGLQQLRAAAPAGDEAALDAAWDAWESGVAEDLRETGRGMSFLATIGSVSPYIGLFGTVWGVIDAFVGLGDLHEASLAAVAPGIAEALFATAAGLFAAIPAVIFYNHFSSRMEALAARQLQLLRQVARLAAHAPPQPAAGAQ